MICATPVLHGPNKGRIATGTSAGYHRHWEAGEPPCDPCRLAINTKTRQWAQANPDKVYARTKRWARENRERRREIERRYAEANPDKRLALQRRWTEQNRERTRAYARERRVRLLELQTVEFTDAQLDERMAFWGYRCWMCGGPFESVDHVKPVSRGGAHILANMRPACVSCNSKKKDAWPIATRLS